MKWLVIPFADRKRAAALMRHFRVPGVPTLVLCDFDSGLVLNPFGRHAVAHDAGARNFPWTP
jgi:hypothetical protein